jgi:hypothetical protein
LDAREWWGAYKIVQSITYSTTIATPNQKDWDGLDIFCFRRMASGVDER